MFTLAVSISAIVSVSLYAYSRGWRSGWGAGHEAARYEILEMMTDKPIRSVEDAISTLKDETVDLILETHRSGGNPTA